MSATICFSYRSWELRFFPIRSRFRLTLLEEPCDHQCRKAYGPPTAPSGAIVRFVVGSLYRSYELVWNIVLAIIFVALPELGSSRQKSRLVPVFSYRSIGSRALRVPVFLLPLRGEHCHSNECHIISIIAPRGALLPNECQIIPMYRSCEQTFQNLYAVLPTIAPFGAHAFHRTFCHLITLPRELLHYHNLFAYRSQGSMRVFHRVVFGLLSLREEHVKSRIINRNFLSLQNEHLSTHCKPL